MILHHISILNKSLLCQLALIKGAFQAINGVLDTWLGAMKKLYSNKIFLVQNKRSNHYIEEIMYIADTRTWKDKI